MSRRPEHPRRRQILIGDGTGYLIDNQIDARAAGCAQHLVDPGRVARVDGDIRTEILQARAPFRVG